MSQSPSRSTYVFDRGQGDQERLVRSSEALSAFTTEGCLRAGLRPAGRAVDAGCGPLGALLALAELVGSEGRVAGLDSSGEALATAPLILTQRGYSTVTLVQGELDNKLIPLLCPPGPFDLAYVRRFWCIRRILRAVCPILLAFSDLEAASSRTRFRRAVGIPLSPRASLPFSPWTSSYMLG